MSVQTAVLRKRMVQSGLLRVSTRNVGSEYKLLIPRDDSRRRNLYREEVPEPKVFLKKKFPPNRKQVNDVIASSRKVSGSDIH